MVNDKISFSIFLDFSKVFDTFDHTILLEKLKYYEVNAAAHVLFKRYLKARKQYVDIGRTLDHYYSIIYINDISFASNLFKFIIYADDTTLETTIEIGMNKLQDASADDKINMELHHINDWLKCNKLSLNIGKSKYMIFRNPNKQC